MKHVLLILFIGIFFGCRAHSLYPESGQPKPDNSVSIPLGGNTYITGGNAGANENQRTGRGAVTERGISGWTDPATVFSVYFRTSTAGELNLFLRYSSASESLISVESLGKQFEVKLEAGQNDTAYIGTVTVSVKDTGYIRVDLRGKAKNGESYAAADYMLVNGEAAGGKMHFVNDFSFYWGRRGPSVHLYYPLPGNEDIEWFYNEITVPEGGGPTGSYYMSNGFGEGYFGIQINREDERRVLFSVWSPFSTDNPKDIPEDMQVKLLDRGEATHTGEFGNEGSGGQSYLIYPWKTGQTYRFLTRVKPDGKGSTVYTSYFYGNDSKWMLVASWLRPKTDTYYRNAHSFLENFNPEKGYLSRKAFYHNQWARTVDGRWIELCQSGFSADETARKQARMDYRGGEENGRFFLQNCGFLSNCTVVGTLFSRAGTGKAPEIDFAGLPAGIMKIKP
ncbi:MAG: DUF3472 domain-containing protein [Prevotellaceae bacterium]|jgi:hypothetical protein|nr:DUF3472 domain-containing protein [Prevotellaceae bacterium]